ncbi:MAG: hypothetical protein NUV80_02270 [Candidatus Berkelbacteria bacterium]|nr:hypothetical protein [Candidatus Berkelbacteria bacterium]MCR4307358.1 hypothetical protein [Candidatus Berkelbacteria bacterium]
MFWVRKNILPDSVKQVLWSYDTAKIDLQQHRRLLVSQVLNYGNREATDWLFRQYSRKEVANIARAIPLGQWDKKSLALWSLILNITPMTKSLTMAER